MSYEIKVGDRLTNLKGERVRIVCTDKLGDFPVVGLVQKYCNKELVYTFTRAGRYHSNPTTTSNYDLVLPPACECDNSTQSSGIELGDSVVLNATLKITSIEYPK